MSKLESRKSKAIFETANAVWQRRKERQIILELKPGYMLLRLKGTRQVYSLSYTSALNVAIRNHKLRIQLEKAKKRGLERAHR